MESQNLAKWLEKSKKSDEKEIELHKRQIINQIKGLSIKDIVPEKKKLTLWQRIRKALNF
jgi:hypothetical protein